MGWVMILCEIFRVEICWFVRWDQQLYFWVTIGVTMEKEKNKRRWYCFWRDWKTPAHIYTSSCLQPYMIVQFLRSSYSVDTLAKRPATREASCNSTSSCQVLRIPSRRTTSGSQARRHLCFWRSAFHLWCPWFFFPFSFFFFLFSSVAFQWKRNK